MADSAFPSATPATNNLTALPTDHTKPPNLSVSLSSPSAASSQHQHHLPSASSPASAIPHLPITHQVLTPHSKPLILTSPPTPTSHNFPASPASTSAGASDLADVAPEDRFVAQSIDAHSTALPADLFRLLSALYLPHFLHPPSALPALTPASLSVTTVTGGITNSLYRVELSAEGAAAGGGGGCTLPAVLVRIFGPSTDQVIDRLTETRLVCELSRSRAGVRIYGHFANGRLEEWLYATPLTPPTMTQYGAHIAATLATLHAQRFGWLGDRASPLYSTLPEWMSAASKLTWDGEAEAAKRRLVAQIDVQWWAGELRDTLRLLRDSRWSDDALVFCHNDLLSGNILLQRKGDADGSGGGGGVSQSTHIFFVDYEYSGNNYAAFDLANHFCECCGFDCDWAQLPTRDQRLAFIRAYITKRQPSIAAEALEAEAAELERKVRAFFVLSHLWWGVWAVVQAKYSTIDFDYMQYSLLRKQGYLRMKEESHTLLRESSK